MDRAKTVLCTLKFALSTGLLAMGTSAQADLVWHWEDRFGSAEQEKLTTWISTTVAGIERSIAPYPFDVHVHFYRRSGAGQPVPWANTIRRSNRQGVNFHVNPEFSPDALRADWTAYHELSHLLIPYLGSRHSWFAEGFASYMQYQIMHALGVLTEEQMQARYQERIGRAERRYDLDDMPFTEAAPTLRARRLYPTMYWGGAVYFLRVDQELRERGQSVVQVIRDFVECCRFTTRGLNGLIAELDRLSRGKSFREQLDQMHTEPGFPDDSEVWPDDD